MRNLVLFVLLLGFASCSYKAADFEEVDGVVVNDESKYIHLKPLDMDNTVGILFYPGGLVEPEAYITTFNPIAEGGTPVVILKATADLAIFNVQRAAKAIEDFPSVEKWVIGGHSLGGVVAIKSILKDTSLFDGLFLFAAYPAENDDLSAWNGAVLSLTAENDSLTTRADVDATMDNLPEAIYVESSDEFPLSSTFGQTIYFEISGGNHAQFGDYGVQKDDGEALISVADQHAVIHKVMDNFLSINFK